MVEFECGQVIRISDFMAPCTVQKILAKDSGCCSYGVSIEGSGKDMILLAYDADAGDRFGATVETLDRLRHMEQGGQISGSWNIFMGEDMQYILLDADGGQYLPPEAVEKLPIEKRTEPESGLPSPGECAVSEEQLQLEHILDGIRNPADSHVQMEPYQTAAEFLSRNPLYPYVRTLKNGRKQLRILMYGNSPLRDSLFYTIIPAVQMLDTQLHIHVIAPDADKFWEIGRAHV